MSHDHVSVQKAEMFESYSLFLQNKKLVPIYIDGEFDTEIGYVWERTQNTLFTKIDSTGEIHDDGKESDGIFICDMTTNKKLMTGLCDTSVILSKDHYYKTRFTPPNTFWKSLKYLSGFKKDNFKEMCCTSSNIFLKCSQILKKNIHIFHKTSLVLESIITQIETDQDIYLICDKTSDLRSIYKPCVSSETHSGTVVSESYYDIPSFNLKLYAGF